MPLPTGHDGYCYTEPGEGGDGAYFFDDGCWRKVAPQLVDTETYEELDGGDA